MAAPGEDATARATAQALAAKLEAEIVDLGPPVDLIVVGSQPSAASRRITLSGSTRTLLNTARGSVLVLPSGVAIDLKTEH